MSYKLVIFLVRYIFVKIIDCISYSKYTHHDDCYYCSKKYICHKTNKYVTQVLIH